MCLKFMTHFRLVSLRFLFRLDSVSVTASCLYCCTNSPRSDRNYDMKSDKTFDWMDVGDKTAV